MMKYILILLFLVIIGCQCNSKRGSEKNLPDKTETYESGKKEKNDTPGPGRETTDENKPQQGAETKPDIYRSDKGSLEDTAAETPVHH